MIYDDDFHTPWDDAERKARNAFELYESGEVYEAISMIDEAISLNPDNAAWHFNKALALDAIACFEEAIEEYKRALELEGEDTEILNAIAVDYTRSGNYDLSLATFEKIQAINPDFEPCYCNRIITYTEIEQHEKAEHMFYLAQQIEPDCPICFYNMGNSLFSRGQFERAIWCWTKTSELDPNHPQINYRIAQGYCAIGSYQVAKKFFLEELRNNPGQIEVILDFGILLLYAGDIKSAREKFNRILEFNPCFAPALFYLGEIANNEDELDSARDLYHQAMQVDNYIPGPRYRLAQMAVEEGLMDEAFSLLKVELELEIDNPNILQSIGTMMLKLNKNDYAVHCFLQATDLNSSDPTTFRLLALTLSSTKRYEDAIQFIEYAASLKPDSFELNLDSALINYKAGDLERADEYIQKAASIRKIDKDLAWLKLRLLFKKAVTTFRPSSDNRL